VLEADKRRGFGSLLAAASRINEHGVGEGGYRVAHVVGDAVIGRLTLTLRQLALMPQTVFRRDVLDGLSRRRRDLPCKYLYDDRGSELFEQITEQPEYYPFRCEVEILANRLAEVSEAVGGRATIVEYGAGSGVKTEKLLHGMAEPTAYVPIDISQWYLDVNAERIRAAHPGLEVTPVQGDYTKVLELPAISGDGATFGFFPGGTLGNFTPRAAKRFLSNVADTLGDGSYLLVGFDLRKNPHELHAAYNDAAGVTAAFNLNILERINRELDANFNLNYWRHYAPFNPTKGRIEMHLVATQDQDVTIAGEAVPFERGESIHTENSYKFLPSQFRRLAATAGWQTRQSFTDEQGMFCVQLLQAG
jgi:dimethylhistidine N-methyltransferase